MSATFLWDIATAVPDHVCTAEQALDLAARIYGDQPAALEFLQRLIPASGIARRHTVIADYGKPPGQRTFFGTAADFRPEPSTATRNQIFAAESNRLAVAACAGLAGDWRGRVTHLVTASCTGFVAPGFDVHLMRALGLSPRVARTHVGFMGCYAGFSTLKLAHALCRADPRALVLVVHVELCSLHVQFRSDPDTLIANALFADGAAAALIGGADHAASVAPEAAPLRLVGSASFLLPGGDDDMTWAIGDRGFDMRLSARVPFLLNRHLPDAFASALDEWARPRADLRHFAIHPGGPAILEKTVQALSLDESDVAVSRDLLRSHGNMSSSTLWFLLDRIRRRSNPGLLYACGFGPGLTLESALLEHPGGA